MSVEYKEILNSANTMLSYSSEVDYRNAISRSYYAAFHACGPIHKKLPKLKIEDDIKGGTHVKFISRFKHSLNVDVRQVGFILKSLHQKRCIADYEIDRDIDKLTAENMYHQTVMLIDLAEKL